ncbi:MAG: hypothetical protein LUF89_06210 [Ruminococcus sp.]|nr:hypothetical protein [Ruminococcus sp.]
MEMDKIGNLLTDPESLQQLQELVQMLRQETVEENPSSKTASENQDDSSSDMGFDVNMLLKVQELMGAMQNVDTDAQFLLALRLHLKEPRQKRVDQAIKFLKIYAIFTAARDNGMLKDFL